MFEVSLARKRPYAQNAVAFLEMIQAWNAVDVDEVRRRCQSEFHKRDKALPPRQEFRLGAILVQEGKRFMQGCRGKIRKLRGNHVASPPTEPSGTLTPSLT